MTDPSAHDWRPPRGEGRASEVSAVIGAGDAVWRSASEDVLSWAVKTRSGFAVDTAGQVAVGDRLRISARIGWIRIVEPVEVVHVVAGAARVGFSYRTLPGHPVSGEEAFIVHRDGDLVHLTVRSITRPAERGGWRLAFPLLRVVQRLVRRRYLRALR
ncbi:DUF1990 family protein [Microbacterium rhizophilus]|uniref:DUF1990 family protein n=1 Tax=Microbacterium rhizophilus TaxID=3138934 RepID=UPI0031EB9DAA